MAKTFAQRHLAKAAIFTFSVVGLTIWNDLRQIDWPHYRYSATGQYQQLYHHNAAIGPVNQRLATRFGVVWMTTDRTSL